MMYSEKYTKDEQMKCLISCLVVFILFLMASFLEWLERFSY